MSVDNPIEKIKTGITSMTNMQKVVADYIIKHPVDVAFMTLEQFAGVIGTSTTTIMRMMYHLGYSGYSEFQKGLQMQLRNKVDPSVRLETNLKDVDKDNIWTRCCEKQIQNIHDTFSMISQSTFDEIIAAIADARRMYFVAARGGMMAAKFMCDFLGRMFGNCQLLQADLITEWCTVLPTLSREDLVVAISFPRYAKRASSFLKHAKEKEARIVLITDNYSSPLAGFATWLLPCACGSLGFHNSPVSAMMIADSIINVASIRHADSVSMRLSEADRVMIADDYYLM
jgi:Transcriptional regulators